MDDLSLQDQEQLQRALAEFVGAFEVVFRHDWQYTLTMIGDEAEGATFIEPELDDETEDWGARGALLEAYRQLVAAMKQCGISPSFPFPIDDLPGSPKR